MKIMKIERCNYCRFFNFKPGMGGAVNRFKCYNPEAIRKNGNYRIINRDTAMEGKFPWWCRLEDYKNVMERIGG